MSPRADTDGSHASFLWCWFTDPAYQSLYAENNRERLGLEYVADLRASSGWTVELTASDGQVTPEAFEFGTAGRYSDSTSSLNTHMPTEEIVPAWLSCIQGQDVGDFTATDTTCYA